MSFLAAETARQDKRGIGTGDDYAPLLQGEREPPYLYWNSPFSPIRWTSADLGNLGT